MLFKSKERFYGCYNFTQDTGRCGYRWLYDGDYLADGRTGAMYGGDDGLQPVRRGVQSVRGGGL